MIKNNPNMLFHCLKGKRNKCRMGRGCDKPEPASAILPLSRTCCRGKVKVCRITGDRKLCARMASMGLLPGSELELICPGHGHNCMVKIGEGTLSLDMPLAENIYVTPV
ncbi:FeoA family protein [Desulfolithobacter sp.]